MCSHSWNNLGFFSSAFLTFDIFLSVVMMYSRNHEIRFSLLIRPSVKKDRNAIGYLDGQVGRYKGGVQHVDPSDLSTGKSKSKSKSKRKKRK